MSEPHRSTNWLLERLVSEQNSNSNEEESTETIGSQSVVVSTYHNGLARLDARASSHNGVETGGAQGRHAWLFSTEYDSVDVLGERSAIDIVANANVTVNDVEVEKSNTGNSWNSSFYSAQSFNPIIEDFAVSWLVEDVTGTIREMGGLDDKPDQNNSYTSIDYAVYQVNNYFYSRVYEKGIQAAIPNYSNFYFQVGDRIGIKCVNRIISYFVIRNGAEIIIYTSKEKASVPLFFKAAFNRGAGSSGHSNIGNVEWHTAKVHSSYTVKIEGYANEVVSNEDIERLRNVGIDINIGATYCDLQWSKLSIEKFGGPNPFPLDYTHSYIGAVSQVTGQLAY